MEETINTDPIEEARKYVANAKEIIEKSKYDPEMNLYRDKKYVRIAGDTLWKGCLIALDALLQIRKGKGRPSIEKYKEAAEEYLESIVEFKTDFEKDLGVKINTYMEFDQFGNILPKFEIDGKIDLKYLKEYVSNLTVLI